MKEALIRLLKVKSLITFGVMTVFVILSLRGDIGADKVMIAVSTVIAFYFGTQTEKRE